MWIDTHCHLDAAEFDADRDDVVARAVADGVRCTVLPAVDVRSGTVVRDLAHRHGLVYALGIHPLAVAGVDDGELDRLRIQLQAHIDDPRLVAVGEIGLDHFVPGHDRARQERFYVAQLTLAAEFGLPVILHVRRSADTLLKHLRRIRVTGIAHAFNGSRQQADTFIALGFKLGVGGAMTFDRALQIRRLAAELPLDALVLETDAPDIPPQWLYRTAEERRAGLRARNEPCEVPRIGAVLSSLRRVTLGEVAHATSSAAVAAVPRLGRWIDQDGAG